MSGSALSLLCGPGVAARRAPTLRLSVIIPFAPDETEGAALLGELQALSQDAEILLAAKSGMVLPAPPKLGGAGVTTRVCHSAVGRARQMNVAAAAAHGRWLWFLHADSRLRPDALAALDAWLARDEDALGYFDLRYGNDGPALARFNALGANLRAHWLGIPFGDQGLVLPAKWFERLGGYDETVACGEDHLLVWQARTAGLPLQPVGAAIVSSARQYARLGWRRATARSLRLTLRQAWPQWRALLRARRRSTA